jgi:hypothetical protein
LARAVDLLEGTVLCGQPLGRVPVAAGGANPQLVGAALFGQQVDQPLGGVPVAAVGANPQLVDGLVGAALFGQ